MARQPEPGTASPAYYAAQSAHWAAQGRPLLARWCAALAERLAGKGKA